MLFRTKEKPAFPLDTSVQAEYADGFILDETEHDDIAQFDSSETKHNIFYDILHRLPEAEHGRMVRFTVFWKNNKYDLDWTVLPENSRPVRFRQGNRSKNMETGEEHFWWSGIKFGFGYTDENGVEQKEIQEMR